MDVYKGADFKSNFSDKIDGVDSNICVDPADPTVIYYRSKVPTDLVRLDLKESPDKWVPSAAPFPGLWIHRQSSLTLRATSFFYSGTDLVIIAKDTLQEVKRVPKLTHVNFEDKGRLRAIDEKGYLVIFELNIAQITAVLDQQRIAKMAQGIDVTDIFAEESAEYRQKWHAQGNSRGFQSF